MNSWVEQDHSHIPIFVKCKKQWEVVCALQCHKNTMLDLALSPLYRERCERPGWKEKSLTHCEPWITAHIVPWSAHQKSCSEVSLLFLYFFSISRWKALMSQTSLLTEIHCLVRICKSLMLSETHWELYYHIKVTVLHFTKNLGICRAERMVWKIHL